MNRAGRGGSGSRGPLPDLAGHAGRGQPVAVGALIAGLALLGAFVVIELRTDVPLLRLDVFANRSYAIVAIATVVGMFAFLAICFSMSIWLGAIQHQSALKVGVLFLFIQGPAYGMVVDGNLRMYIGRGTKIYFLPLRHRGQVSFDITALCPDSTWAPAVTKDDLLKTVEGFDERIVNITRDLDLDAVNCRAVYDIDPIDTWHSDSVVLVGDAAHSMLHYQGQGANSAILDAGALADALKEADSVKEALALYQAARKPVTDELQRISRQGWTEDEINDVFPGQKPASQNPQG